MRILLACVVAISGWATAYAQTTATKSIEYSEGGQKLVAELSVHGGQACNWMFLAGAWGTDTFHLDAAGDLWDDHWLRGLHIGDFQVENTDADRWPSQKYLTYNQRQMVIGRASDGDITLQFTKDAAVMHCHDKK